MIKILFLAASPADMPHLSLDEESRAIEQALRQAEFRDQFTVEQAWAVRIVDLQELLLRHKPDVVHFSGHGSPANEIILQDEAGQSRPLSPSALGKLFAILKDNVRCVVLNACYSEVQAKAIAQIIDCVIGMSVAIGDKAAIRFASTFYQALGYGKDVQTAFDLGCLQLDMENLAERDTPRLFAEKQKANQLVFVANQSKQPLDAPVHRRKRIPLAIWVALIGLVGSLSAALVTVLPALLPKNETLPVVTNSPAPSPQPLESTTPSIEALPTSDLATLTLPEFAPLLTTTVAAVMQVPCQNLQPAFVRTVEDSLKVIKEHPPVLMKSISPVADGAAARRQGELDGINLVVWGECPQQQLTAIHFELLVERGAPEAFEPISLVITQTSDIQVARAISALATYLRRDYLDASNSFSLLAESAVGAEQKAWWRLLQGNSYLFRRQYNEAINAYAAAMQAQPTWAGAYHNLGVAHMNAAWKNYQFEPAFTAFTQTLELAPDFSLTYAVRGQLWLWLASVDGSTAALDRAATECEQASAGNRPTRGTQALARICLSQVQINRYRSGIEQAAVDLNELALANLSTSYWSAPLVTQGLLHYFLWRNTQNIFDRDQAESWLMEAIQAGHDDVFLEGSRDTYVGLPALLRSLQPASYK